MEELFNLISSPWGYLLDAISLASTVLLLVFMHYSAKHRNKELSVIWYICGFIFPLITVIAFLIKRRKFPSPETRICPMCGNKFPEGFTMCNRCLIELPKVDEAEKAKQKKISKITGVCFGITFTISTVAIIALIAVIVIGFFDAFLGYPESNRIGVTDEAGKVVYYDKMGNTYEEPYDVVLYDESGNSYTYFVETAGDEYPYDEYYYIDKNGEKYDVYSCYVNADGWFYYDENWELELDINQLFLDDEDYTYDENEKDVYDEDYGLGDLYADIKEDAEAIEQYKYYDDVYTDSDGNIYYWAEEASWNEKGELITAENDPTITE